MLSSSSATTREAAIISLLNKSSYKKVIEKVAQCLLDDSSSIAQAACLDLLERLDAVHSLGEIKLDLWFKEISGKINNFNDICEIIGERFLAYSIILDVQIKALTKDTNAPANTMVEFATGDNSHQVLSLGEYQTRLIQALLKYKSTDPSNFSLPIDDDIAILLIDRMIILLAPLFNLSISQLIVVPDSDSDDLKIIIGFVSPVGFNFMSLANFKQYVLQKVRKDLTGVQEEPFQLDLSALGAAQKAALENNHEDVIAILETWPGLLTTLRRSPVALELNKGQLVQIIDGLVLLGNAFKTKNRYTWAEELYRLAFKYTKNINPPSKLFAHMGLLLNDQERYGEAISYFRRAIVLGGSEEDIFPHLGHAFFKRNKNYAALLLFEDVASKGIITSMMKLDVQEIKKTFEKANISWNNLSLQKKDLY